MKVALRILFLLTLFWPTLLHGQSGSSGEKVTKINKVVIDPGHGGKDPGCVYKNYLEKDITLSIGLKLGDLIKKNFPEVQVYYTRTTDKYVDLADRGKIANKAGADLFISIHVNSFSSGAISGSSTYIMGVDKTNQNLEVAMKENDVIIYEEDYSTKYEGYTPGDPTSYIMFSLMQSAYRDQSMQFAEIIQKHFAHDLPLKDRGAFQGPFLVLWRTSMPAVLTEVGFMSNERDRAYIITNKGQSEAARSLFNAFSEYKSKVEGRASVVLLKERTSLPDPTAQLTAEQKAQVEALLKEEQKKAGTSATTPEQKTVAAAEKPATQTQPKSAPQQSSAQQTPGQKPTASQQQQKPAASQQQPQGQKPASETQQKPAATASQQQKQTPAAASQQQQRPTTSQQSQGQKPTPVSATHSIRFYVQVASLTKPKNINSTDFKSYRGRVIESKMPNGTYKYLFGGYTSYDEAIKQLNVVRREFKDAFLVAFEGDSLIKLDDARRRAK